MVAGRVIVATGLARFFEGKGTDALTLFACFLAATSSASKNEEEDIG